MAHIVLVDALTSGKNISTCIVQTIAGLAAIQAKIFIDSTDDAYLARNVGVPFERGYEKTGNNQPLSFRFEMGGIDMEKLYKYVVVDLQEDWCKSELPYFKIAEAMHRKQRYKLEALMARGVETGELTQEEAEYMQAYAIIRKTGVMSCNFPEIPIKFKSTDPVEYSKAVTYGRKMIHNMSQYLIRHLLGVVYRRARRKNFKLDCNGALHTCKLYSASVNAYSGNLYEYRRSGGNCGGLRLEK